MFPPLSPLASLETQLDWIQLIRTPTIGPITFWKLLAAHKEAAVALEVLSHRHRTSFGTAPCPFSRDETKKEYEKTLKIGASYLFYGQKYYPSLLKSLEDAPPVLTVKGLGVMAVHKPRISVVGARNASFNGKRFAENLAKELGHQGIEIISGMARGIDTHAHQGALPTGTVAILAGGVDMVYPLENKGLYDQILEQGLVLSECAPGTSPQTLLFPRRNRLIAGMSWGTVIIEAALKSGSLITADFALKNGREVFAVPGFPLDPRARGTNHLLRQGATLVESADDILMPLNAFLNSPLSRLDPQPLRPELDFPPEPKASYGSRLSYRPFNEGARIQEDSRRIMDDTFANLRRGSAIPSPLMHTVIENLSMEPVMIDELIRQCGYTASDTLEILTELELLGRIIRHPGNQVSLISG